MRVAIEAERWRGRREVERVRREAEETRRLQMGGREEARERIQTAIREMERGLALLEVGEEEG